MSGRLLYETRRISQLPETRRRRVSGDTALRGGMPKRSASKYAAGSSSDAKEAKESQASTYSGDSNIVIETVPHDGGQQTVCAT